MSGKPDDCDRVDSPATQGAQKKTKKLRFENMSAATRKTLTKLGIHLSSQIALQMLRDGSITTAGKSDADLRAEIAEKILLSMKKRNNIAFRIDHTQYLLKEARAYARRHKFEISALFYASYFEHELNRLIVVLCEGKNISIKSISSVLREANIRAKCSWVLELLGQKPMKISNTAAIYDISEIRNAFVHYKWPSESFEITDQRKISLSTKLARAESAVRYLRKYEESNIHRNEGNRIRRVLRKRPSNQKA